MPESQYLQHVHQMVRDFNAADQQHNKTPQRDKTSGNPAERIQFLASAACCYGICVGACRMFSDGQSTK